MPSAASKAFGAALGSKGEATEPSHERRCEIARLLDVRIVERLMQALDRFARETIVLLGRVVDLALVHVVIAVLQLDLEDAVPGISV
jgi:hypothetical protein